MSTTCGSAHLAKSASISAGRPGGLIREITWKRGEIRGNMLTRQPPYIGRMAKNFSPSNDILRLIYSRFVQFMGVLCNGV